MEAPPVEFFDSSVGSLPLYDMLSSMRQLLDPDFLPIFDTKIKMACLRSSKAFAVEVDGAIDTEPISGWLELRKSLAFSVLRGGSRENVHALKPWLETLKMTAEEIKAYTWEAQQRDNRIIEPYVIKLIETIYVEQTKNAVGKEPDAAADNQAEEDKNGSGDKNNKAATPDDNDKDKMSEKSGHNVKASTDDISDSAWDTIVVDLLAAHATNAHATISRRVDITLRKKTRSELLEFAKPFIASDQFPYNRGKKNSTAPEKSPNNGKASADEPADDDDASETALANVGAAMEDLTTAPTATTSDTASNTTTKDSDVANNNAKAKGAKGMKKSKTTKSKSKKKKNCIVF